MRRFGGVAYDKALPPDETTLCTFPIILGVMGRERRYSRESLGTEGKGLKIGFGTIVDAAVIVETQSLKNRDQQRDPQMRSGNMSNL